MRALVATYFLAAALAMPALLWAADDPPAAPPAATEPAAGPSGSTTVGTTPAPSEPDAKADKAAADEPRTKTKDLAPVARAAASDAVTIKSFKYSPATVIVSVGDTVKWTNQDTAPHTATADDGSFDTGTLNKGDSGSETFDKAGTFAYICTIHPTMKGKVVVKSAAGDDTGTSGGSSDSSSSDSSVDPFEPTSGEDAADSTSSLADTGTDVAIVALAGLLLLGAGALLRRRFS